MLKTVHQQVLWGRMRNCTISWSIIRKRPGYLALGTHTCRRWLTKFRWILWKRVCRRYVQWEKLVKPSDYGFPWSRKSSQSSCNWDTFKHVGWKIQGVAVKQYSIVIFQCIFSALVKFFANWGNRGKSCIGVWNPLVKTYLESWLQITMKNLRRLWILIKPLTEFPAGLESCCFLSVTFFPSSLRETVIGWLGSWCRGS